MPPGSVPQIDVIMGPVSKLDTVYNSHDDENKTTIDCCVLFYEVQIQREPK